MRTGRGARVGRTLLAILLAIGTAAVVVLAARGSASWTAAGLAVALAAPAGWGLRRGGTGAVWSFGTWAAVAAVALGRAVAEGEAASERLRAAVWGAAAFLGTSLVAHWVLARRESLAPENTDRVLRSQGDRRR